MKYIVETWLHINHIVVKFPPLFVKNYEIFFMELSRDYLAGLPGFLQPLFGMLKRNHNPQIAPFHSLRDRIAEDSGVLPDPGIPFSHHRLIGLSARRRSAAS